MACVSVELIDEYIHTDGEKYIVPGNSWTVRATTIVHDEDTEIYISYTGSTAKHGSEFFAPTSIKLLAGDTYVDFEINIPLEYDCNICSNLIVIVASTSTISSCETTHIDILCDDAVEVIIRIPGKDCCLFYDKTHERWRDYYPTCMGSNPPPSFPGNMLDDGGVSTYDWYDSELYK